MDHVLAGSGIRLTYLQDRRAIGRIDWLAVFDDLNDAGAPPNRCQWCDLDGLSHVVLATDRATGRHVGLLGLVGQAKPMPWLRIEAAMVRPDGSAKPGETGHLLLRAMTAHMLARVVSLDGKPLAVTASRADHAIEAALRDLGLNIRFAVQHPPPEGNVIAFPVASLARWMRAPGLVLDLRPVAETSLLRDLRAMHRVRVERAPKRVAVNAAAAKAAKAKPENVKTGHAKLERAKPGAVKPARSASPTRRPRTTIHTGRTA